MAYLFFEAPPSEEAHCFGAIMTENKFLQHKITESEYTIIQYGVHPGTDPHRQPKNKIRKLYRTVSFLFR